jgi:transcription factor WhiB
MAGRHTTPAPYNGELTWQEHARCIDMTDVFEGRTPTDKQRAKAICAECPVKAPCNDLGLSVPNDQLIYAGKTHSQRKQELRAMRMAAQ